MDGPSNTPDKKLTESPAQLPELPDEVLIPAEFQMSPVSSTSIATERVNALAMELEAAQNMDVQFEILERALEQNSAMAELKGSLMSLDGYQIQVTLPVHVEGIKTALERAERVGVSSTPRYIDSVTSRDGDAVAIIAKFPESNSEHRIVSAETAQSLSAHSYKHLIEDLQRLADVGLSLERADDPTNWGVNTQTGKIYLLQVDFEESPAEVASAKVQALRDRYLGE
jgi:hypothetical protein